MQDYEKMVLECYEELIKKYKFRFAKYDNDEFFFVGYGFALKLFVDRSDRRADVWYVSLDSMGNIKEHTLMYIQKERYKPEDFSLYGNPKSIDTQIKADMTVDSAGLLNHCQDILSGDKAWLKNYQDEEGVYSRHIARFLKPIFESQGYHVAPVPDSYNS